MFSEEFLKSRIGALLDKKALTFFFSLLKLRKGRYSKLLFNYRLATLGLAVVATGPHEVSNKSEIRLIGAFREGTAATKVRCCRRSPGGRATLARDNQNSFLAGRTWELQGIFVSEAR